MGGMNILTPLMFGNSKMLYPLCSVKSRSYWYQWKTKVKFMMCRYQPYWKLCSLSKCWPLVIQPTDLSGIPFGNMRLVWVFRTLHYAKDSRNFGWKSNRKIHFHSFDRNIWDHLWRWSTYFSLNIPTEIHRSIFDKQVFCPTSLHLRREFGKGIKDGESHSP